MCFAAFESTQTINEDGTITITPHPLVVLAHAARGGDKVHITQYLQDNTNFHIDQSFYYGSTLLAMAVNNDQYETVKFLVNEHNANPYFSHGLPTSSEHQHFLSVNMHSACYSAIHNNNQQMIQILGGCANKANTDMFELID